MNAQAIYVNILEAVNGAGYERASELAVMNPARYRIAEHPEFSILAEFREGTVSVCDRDPAVSWRIDFTDRGAVPEVEVTGSDWLPEVARHLMAGVNQAAVWLVTQAS